MDPAYVKHTLILLLVLSCGMCGTSNAEDQNFDIDTSTDGSGSGDEVFDEETKIETVVHEITFTTPRDDGSPNPPGTTPNPPCTEGESCAVTESPTPTRVLDIDLEEDSNSERSSFLPHENIGKPLEDIEKRQKKDEGKNEYYFTAILEALTLFDKEKFIDDVTRKMEGKFAERFEKIENSLEEILRLLTSTKLTMTAEVGEAAKKEDERTLKPTVSAVDSTIPSPKNREETDLVVTDTWAYIDSKFSDIKVKLLDANDGIRKDLDEKMDAVLEKYGNNKDPTKENTSATDREATSGIYSTEEIKQTTVTVCKSCCEDVALSVFLDIQNQQGKQNQEDFYYIAATESNQRQQLELKENSNKRLELVKREEGVKRDLQPEYDEPVWELSSTPNQELTTALKVTESWSTTVAPSRPVDATLSSVTFGDKAETTLPPPSVEVILANVDLDETEKSIDNADDSSTKASASLFTLLTDLYQRLNRVAPNATSRVSKESIELPGENQYVVRESRKSENISFTTVAAEVTTLPTPKPNKHDIPRSCAEIYLEGTIKSGLYRVSPFGRGLWTVYCDMDTDGGGWTVIQRRKSGNVNFTRGWNDYKSGFGSMNGDFWLGLDRMHVLTESHRKKSKMSLRIDLKDWSGVSQFAHYHVFKVGSEEQKYRLVVKGYRGTAGNALQYGESYNHNFQGFTTIDRDNDGYTHGNCGAYYGSGWWFNACFAANLNGKFYDGTYHGIQNGIYWGTWYRLNDAETNARHSFKYVDMKVRPANFLERRRGNEV